MIPIKINGQNKRIKETRELTVKEFIKCFEIFREKETFNLIHYLSIVLDIDYRAASKINIENPDVILAAIGEMKWDYHKLSYGKSIKIKDQTYKLEAIRIETVGQRVAIEENCRDMPGEETLCFVLAVAIEPDIFNMERISEIKEQLMNMPYTEVLPFAFFLAKNLILGYRKETKYLHRLKHRLRMKG